MPERENRSLGADLRKASRRGVLLSLVGLAGILFTHWMVFFWVPTEGTMGIIQRINYIHVPVAWVTELAFGLTALASIIYLWLRDDRADAAAVAAAEGGLYFCVALLIAGSLWGRVAWGTFWTWEPRLTFTLLLWFIFFGYFLVRNSTQNPERGKRLGAIVAIAGALDIPVIHMSVYWFRSLHPEPVYLRPDGPSAPTEFVLTLVVAFVAYTILFLGLLSLRYGVEVAEREWNLRTTLARKAAP
jgi:heme exporter protein C